MLSKTRSGVRVWCSSLKFYCAFAWPESLKGPIFRVSLTQIKSGPQLENTKAKGDSLVISLVSGRLKTEFLG